MTPFFSSSVSSSPDWCTEVSQGVMSGIRSDATKQMCSLPMMISHPPTNSPFTYTCGIVGHSLSPVMNSVNLSTPAQRQNRIRNSRELLNRSPQLLILQHIERLQLLRRHTLDFQNLHRGTREPARRCVGSAFHEQHDGGGGHRLLQLRSDFLRETPPCERKRRGGE